ncbi:hypothetical protein AAMO2058_001700900 [Amorphochlora amoebiformis]
MFILALLSDTLTLKPKDFGRDKKEIIVDELNIKYSNKIIPNLGMCIAVRAIENVQHPKHIAGTSGVHIRVRFRVIVFRPFIGEVLLGTVSSADETGITITLGGFFDDIYVGKSDLPFPSEYDKDKGLWSWNYEGNLFPLTSEEDVRFRVTDIKFTVSKPNRDELEGKMDAYIPPMKIVGTVTGEGLGMVGWWNRREDDGGAAEEEEMDVEEKDES